jgi:nitrate/TMAO reductase-like tetraheme cytochrome c subunit
MTTPPLPVPPAGPPAPEEPSPAAVRPRWQRLLGIRRREGRFLHWGLTRWGMVLAFFFCAAIGMGAFGEYSMQPAFCESCHIMEPYYKAWHESTHKNVACVDCHFDPGIQNTLYGKFQASSQAVKYVTATYGSKPHAEIHDAACLRSGCHEKRLLEGKVNWKITTERGNTVTIRFDHTPHLEQERRGKQLRCVSCHSQIVQGRHIVVTTDTCFLCHFKGLKHGRDDQTIGTCKGCHDAPKGEIKLATGTFNHAEYAGRGVLCENCHADSVKGDGAVPRQICWNCHNQTDQIARYGETNAMHKAHVTDHKVECSGCHVQIEHSLNAGRDEEGPANARHLGLDSGSCGLCHEQLHLGPREMFSGVGGKGVPSMPSPMSRAHVNCIACHMTRKNDTQAADVVGQTFVASQDRCDYCHGTKYRGVLDEWRKTLTTQLDRTEVALAKVRTARTGRQPSPETDLAISRLLDDADFNVRFVKLGRGLHNVTYATALLNAALDNAKKAQDLLDNKEQARLP